MTSVWPFQPKPIPNPWNIVNKFKQAAINAKLAGFDGVEREPAFQNTFDKFLTHYLFTHSPRRQWNARCPIP